MLFLHWYTHVVFHLWTVNIVDYIDWSSMPCIPEIRPTYILHIAGFNLLTCCWGFLYLCSWGVLIGSFLFLVLSLSGFGIKIKVASKNELKNSLVAQWLRIHLPMQGAHIQALVREDPTCRGATKPVRHNYWACALEPVSHNYWSPCTTTTEAHAPRPHAP